MAYTVRNETVHSRHWHHIRLHSSWARKKVHNVNRHIVITQGHVRCSHSHLTDMQCIYINFCFIHCQADNCIYGQDSCASHSHRCKIWRVTCTDSLTQITTNSTHTHKAFSGQDLRRSHLFQHDVHTVHFVQLQHITSQYMIEKPGETMYRYKQNWGLMLKNACQNSPRCETQIEGPSQNDW
jgi:hypothetical protein